MKIFKWLTLPRISIILYLIALFLPVLSFYEAKSEINWMYDNPRDKFSRYSIGLEALLFGWLEKNTWLPWFSNILYFIVLSTEMRKNFFGFLILVVSIFLALQILNFDIFIRHVWKNRIPEEVSLRIGFYFWLASYIVLLIGAIIKIRWKKIRFNKNTI